MNEFEKAFEKYTKLKIGRLLRAFVTLGGFLAIFVGIAQTVIGGYLQKIVPSILKEYSSELLLSLLAIIAYSFYTIHEKITGLEIQENFRYRLNNLYNSLKKSEERLNNNIYLSSLQEEILKEASRQIEKISASTDNNVLPINDEFERVQYIRHLFNNNNAKEIIALTYDYNGYFMNFWGGLSYEKFVDANINAARRAKIKRFFVFNKADFENPENSEKRDLFNDIMSGLTSIHNIETRLIWEEHIPNNIKIPKRSFLLIDENITSEIKYNESAGYLAFGHKESINRLKKRYHLLDRLPEDNI